MATTEEKLTRMELQKRGKGKALVCEYCFHPTAYIQNGKLILTSKHGSQIHQNSLTAEDLEKLAQKVRESVILPANRVA